MPIQLHLEHRLLQIPRPTQSLAKAAASRYTMRFQFNNQLAQTQLAYTPSGTLDLPENVLRYMLTCFSEQLVYQPLEEMQYYFHYNTGAFLDPGYPPLFYARQNRKLVTPNKSAVAGIGEAVAGFLAQRLYKCRTLARPNHDYPDIVMDDGTATFLVESKATVGPIAELAKTLDEELPRMIAYASVCLELDARPAVGLLVGTALQSDTNYYCCITEIRV